MITHDDAAATTAPAAFENNNGSLAVSLARCEIDQQITTARAYPRSITKAINGIVALATLDEVSATECIYAVPRDGKILKGPSIRLAEIIAGQWGNCRVGARVVHVDRFEKYVEAEGMFHDLETNMATVARVKRSIRSKSGQVYKEDMIIVTGNAACSIAKRNAILAAVPRGISRKAYAACEAIIIGDVKSLGRRRASAILTLTTEYKIMPEQIFYALEVDGEDDIDLDRLATLTAMRTALKNGEATVEEMFPRREAPTNGGPKNLTDKLNAIAEGSNIAPRDPPHDPETGEIDEAAILGPPLMEDDPTGEKAAHRLAGMLNNRAAAAQAHEQPTDMEHDPALQALMVEAHEKAKGGAAIFKKWVNSLGAPDFERIKPHLDSLREQAIFADEGRKP